MAVGDAFRRQGGWRMEASEQAGTVDKARKVPVAG